jgi:hypothetical protein
VGYEVASYTYEHKDGWGAVARCKSSTCRRIRLGTDDLKPEGTEAAAKNIVLRKFRLHVARVHDE